MAGDPTVAAPAGHEDRRPLVRRLLRWETALVVLLLGVGLVGERTAPGFLTGTQPVLSSAWTSREIALHRAAR